MNNFLIYKKFSNIDKNKILNPQKSNDSHSKISISSNTKDLLNKKHQNDQNIIKFKLILKNEQKSIGTASKRSFSEEQLMSKPNLQKKSEVMNKNISIHKIVSQHQNFNKQLEDSKSNRFKSKPVDNKSQDNQKRKLKLSVQLNKKTIQPIYQHQVLKSISS